MRRIPLRIEASNGRVGERGEAEAVRPTFGARLRRSAGLFGAGVVGLGFLFVPLLHALGVIVFLAMTFMALKRLAVGEVLRSASGECPACGHQGPFFVGLGWRPVRFPVASSCSGCAMALTLSPLAG